MGPVVYFCHGKESGPWGLKIRALAKVAERLGCRVVSLDEQGNDDPELRVQHLVTAAGADDRPLILAGSSMGGYVAAVAAETLHPRGLFLMAPAIGLPGYALRDPQPVAEETLIVHGWDDDVVPLGPVMEFAGARRMPLCVVPAGHALHEQLVVLERLFEDFLQDCLNESAGKSGSQRLLACL